MTGQIQHWVVAWVYVALELSVPATVYVALNYNGSLESIMVRPSIVCRHSSLFHVFASSLFFMHRLLASWWSVLPSSSHYWSPRDFSTGQVEWVWPGGSSQVHVFVLCAVLGQKVVMVIRAVTGGLVLVCWHIPSLF